MSWELTIENIAGIRAAEASVRPGVNTVRASNWQGKSSFIAAVETAFGTAAPLTEGQSSGRVVLRTDEGAFTVELDRSNGPVTSSGHPYLTDRYDRVRADLFAFLGEDNEIRRAVGNGETLESVLTRPLDFENIDQQIADLRAERDRVERELGRAEQAASRLPDLQRRVTTLESDLETLRAERAEIDVPDGTDDAPRETLSDLRADRDRESNRIDRLEGTVDRLRERLADERADLESLTVPEADFQRELERNRERLRDLDRDIELVQSIYETSRRILDEDRVDLVADVSRDIVADTVRCWLCGEEATRADIESRVERLGETLGDLRTTASEYRAEVERLEDKQAQRRTQRRRKSTLQHRIAEIESQLAEAERNLDDARERRSTLQARIDDLAENVDATRDRLAGVESDIKFTEAQLDDARAELDDAETRSERRRVLEDEHDELSDRIATLRNRKTTVKRRTRDAFDAALDDLLDVFETGFETARLTSTFDVVVARDGRETALDALSEGERDLLAVVVALAGHEAFDVAEHVPVMLLDGLGSLASDNLRVLVGYLADRTEYLILTAYPEHADFDGHELSPSDWEVLSDDDTERSRSRST